MIRRCRVPILEGMADDGVDRPAIRVFDYLRYPSSKDDQFAPDLLGHPSFFLATKWPEWPGLEGRGRAQSSKGIDAIAPVRAVDGIRRPAIIIDSSPSEAGSSWTPWHDELSPEDGFIRYFGDNMPDRGLNPLGPAGNKVLADEQFLLHQGYSREERLRAAPLLFFESAGPRGESSGYRRFLGYGLIERCERVVQVEPDRPGVSRSRSNRLYLNYRYDCLLLDLMSEDLEFPWEWVAARADPTRGQEECLALAPESWRRWVRFGSMVARAFPVRAPTGFYLNYRYDCRSDRQAVPVGLDHSTVRRPRDRLRRPTRRGHPAGRGASRGARTSQMPGGVGRIDERGRYSPNRLTPQPWMAGRIRDDGLLLDQCPTRGPGRWLPNVVGGWPDGWRGNCTHSHSRRGLGRGLHRQSQLGVLVAGAVPAT